MLLVASLTLLNNTIKIAKNKKEYYYVMNDNKIPSIYNILGNRFLYSYKSFKDSNVYNKEYKYKKIKNVKSDIEKYSNVLKNEYNFLYNKFIKLDENNGYIELISNPNENNNIFIKIFYNKDNYTIIITEYIEDK